MSTAAEQVRSTRSDARAFADAFSAADDAFTFADAGESRTVSLSELGAVLDLDTPVGLPEDRPQPAPSRSEPSEDEGLLTLAELSDVLARPAADELDFDFGTGTAERARRRTAARRQPPAARVEPSRRRASGPAPARAAGVPRADADAAAARLAATSAGHRAARRTPAIAEPLAPPAKVSRALAPVPSSAPPAPRPLPGSGVVQRFRAQPDRLALYAVLLGILLVLIAASSSASGATSGLVLQLR